MTDPLSLQETIALLMLGLGLAMLGGNALALWRGRKGRRPDANDGELHAGRAWFLLVVGAIITVWASVSLG